MVGHEVHTAILSGLQTIEIYSLNNFLFIGKVNKDFINFCLIF